MPNRLAIDIGRARQLAVIGQLLSLPRPRSIEETVRGLFAVQMDPTSSIARTEHLVLWSRLGERYRPAALERLLWKERSLFCYRAHIVPTSDLGLHQESMRRFPHSGAARHRYVRDWLAANAAFRGTCCASCVAKARSVLATSRITRLPDGGRAGGTTRATIPR
jgi:uncharacterized protein YcaQ